MSNIQVYGPLEPKISFSFNLVSYSLFQTKNYLLPIQNLANYNITVQLYHSIETFYRLR